MCVLTQALLYTQRYKYKIQVVSRLLTYLHFPLLTVGLLISQIIFLWEMKGALLPAFCKK